MQKMIAIAAAAALIGFTGVSLANNHNMPNYKATVGKSEIYAVPAIEQFNSNDVHGMWFKYVSNGTRDRGAIIDCYGFNHIIKPGVRSALVFVAGFAPKLIKTCAAWGGVSTQHLPEKERLKSASQFEKI